jgi:hypothetical protein
MDFSNSYPTPEILYKQSVASSQLPNDYQIGTSSRGSQQLQLRPPPLNTISTSEPSSFYGRGRVEEWNWDFNGCKDTQVPNYLLQPIYPWMKTKKSGADGKGKCLIKLCPITLICYGYKVKEKSRAFYYVDSYTRIMSRISLS